MYGRMFSFTAMCERRRKRDFRTYIRRYTSPNDDFEYGYLQYSAFLQFRLKLEHCKPQKATRHLIICDVISDDVKLFPTVYGYNALNIYEIRRRLLWGEHILYIRAKMTSFFNNR